MNKKLGALSLIELVFVIAIIAILSTIALHNFIGVHTFGAERQLHKIENDLRTIRMEAIRNRKQTSLSFSSKGYSIYVKGEKVFEDEYVDSLQWEPSLSKFSNISSSSFSFSESGKPSNAGSVVFKVGRKIKKEIVVAPVTGIVTLRKANEEDKSF